jgi:hypothetical protein
MTQARRSIGRFASLAPHMLLPARAVSVPLLLALGAGLREWLALWRSRRRALPSASSPAPRR